jgi:hypothetical protein
VLLVTTPVSVTVAPMLRVGFAGDSATEATVAAELFELELFEELTVTATVADLPPAVAVITAGPVATAVTVAVDADALATVAMLALDVDQPIVCPDIAFPEPSRTVTVTVVVPPTVNVALAGEI